jgi:sterol desaturase/sphingolipid hydroxylase (fatty acid hydroxylase superfamily)
MRNPVARIIVNALLSALAFATGFFTVRVAAHQLIGWSSGAGFGLLNWVPLPLPLQFLVGFLLMDLTFYYWHRANHAFGLLWRFHNVHHLDPDMDVTTSFRFHFAEVLYSVGFRVFQVTLIGVSLFTYAAYELVFQCATMFHHSNLRLPIRVERWINKVIVTPRMHGIHHSVVRDETNSNYSVVFRWWDAFHRTLRVAVPQAAIRIGVAGYQDPADNRLWSLLAGPFRRQKDHWRFSDGSEPVRMKATGGHERVLAE